MKRPSWLKLPSLAHARDMFSGLGQRRLLALDFDGFVLRAAVIEARKGEPRLIAHAQSRTMPIAAALEEVLEQLRATQNRVPRRCVLATVQMLAAEVHLPVEPAKPRKRPQMLELTRWELEPQASQAAVLWNLGAVLAGMGLLTPSQRLTVVANAREGRGQPLRFGERARELGLIGAEQLEQALLAQKQLQGHSPELDVDYHPMRGAPREGEWPWLGVAIDRQSRAAWFETCRAAGLVLTHLYPRAGLTALAAAQDDADGVEIRADAVVVWSRREGALAALNLEPRPETAITGADLLALLPPPAADRPDKAGLFYHADGAEAGLADAFARAWGGRAKAVAPGGLEPAWAPLYGMARHALGMAGAQTCARIVGRERAQLHRHPDFPRFALTAAVLLGVTGGEIRLQWRHAAAERRLAQIEAEFKRDSAVESQVQAAQAQAANLKQVVERLRTRAAELANRASLLDERLIGRLELVPAVLQSLAAAINDEVVLESVREAGRQEGFNVVAWGGRDEPLLVFARDAQERLAELGMGVVDTDFGPAPGRVAEPGFRLSFWAVRDPDRLLQSAAGESRPMARAESDGRRDTPGADQKNGGSR